MRIKPYDKKAGVMICPCGAECDCIGEGSYTIPHMMDAKGIYFVKFEGYIGKCENKKCGAEVLNWLKKTLMFRAYNTKIDTVVATF